jgi:hypothetical protein
VSGLDAAMLARDVSARSVRKDVWDDFLTWTKRFFVVTDREVAGTFIDVIQAFLHDFDVEHVLHLLGDGLIGAAAESIVGQIEHDRKTWAPLLASTRAARLAAAEAAPQLLDLTTPEGRGPVVQVHFDVGNPSVGAALQANDLRLIREISEETRQAVRQFLSARLAQGVNPVNVVQELVGRQQPDGTRQGGVLGLTTRQTQAVVNYRHALETGQREALDRALRDRRYDPSVQAMLRGERDLSPEQIDRMVNRYEARFLAYRAETIGRTEAARAMAAGQQMAWDQAIQDGDVQSTHLVKRWVTAHDFRVRPEIRLTSKGPRQSFGFGIEGNHRQMDGQEVEYDEMFTAPDTGEQVWGPPAGVNCRCIAWIRPRRGL